MWQVNYSLKETEWSSFRKRVLQDFCGLFALTVFVSWFGLSAPLSILHSLADSSQWGMWNVCDIAALLSAAPLLSCPWLCHHLSCPFLPTDCQTLWGFWNHLLTTPCASTPLSTQSHTSSTSLGSSPVSALNSPCFPPLFPCSFLSAYRITTLGQLLLHLLCLDVRLCRYQHWNPSPLLQTHLENRRLVSLAGVAYLLSFIFWLLELSQLGAVVGVLGEDRKT